MHYKNGRTVTIGDWVVGPTHNSQHKLLCGKVLEVMPEQGPCNVKLLVFPSYLSHLDKGDEGPHITLAAEKEPWRIGYKTDYADAKELVRVDDGWRMIRSVEEFGNWDAGAFPVTMG